jgi:peptidoglycan/LPS O-acetylase OafA/YrhL
MTTTHRTGSFDLIRLIAALMVLWSHQFDLMKLPEPGFFGTTASEIGVFIFFAISGYLNSGSLLRGQSWWRFLLRRARRIFPALVGLAIFCVLLGIALTTAGGAAFWAKVPDFVFRNSTILFGIRYTLPGVFETNPFPGAMNGSLWTLPHEIKLYIYLAIVAVVVRYRPDWLLGVLAAVLAGFLVWFHLATKNPVEAYFQKFAVLFITGALLALAERRWGFWPALAALAFVAVVSGLTTAIVGWLPAMALVYLLIGKIEAPSWLQPPLDISYGVYLYAFSLQQLGVMLGMTFWPSLALSVVTTTVMAVLSAVFIEQPALARRKAAAETTVIASS